MPSVRKEKPPRDFRIALCDCCTDPALACTMCCCGPTATGQIYERVTRVPRSCLAISALLWTLFFIEGTLSSVGQRLSIDAVIYETGTLAPSYVVLAVAGAIASVAGLISTCVVCSARRRVRARDNIRPSACGQCEDCCVAYWCTCCALNQMFVHEGATSNSYELCAAQG